VNKGKKGMDALRKKRRMDQDERVGTRRGSTQQLKATYGDRWEGTRGEAWGGQMKTDMGLAVVKSTIICLYTHADEKSKRTPLNEWEAQLGENTNQPSTAFWREGGLKEHMEK